MNNWQSHYIGISCAPLHQHLETEMMFDSVVITLAFVWKLRCIGKPYCTSKHFTKMQVVVLLFSVHHQKNVVVKTLYTIYIFFSEK